MYIYIYIYIYIYLKRQLIRPKTYVYFKFQASAQQINCFHCYYILKNISTGTISHCMKHMNNVKEAHIKEAIMTRFLQKQSHKMNRTDRCSKNMPQTHKKNTHVTV